MRPPDSTDSELAYIAGNRFFAANSMIGTRWGPKTGLGFNKSACACCHRFKRINEIIGTAHFQFELQAQRVSRNSYRFRATVVLAEGLQKKAIRLTRGKASFKSSSLLPPSSGERIAKPVTLAPGFARLSTSPLPTGSPTPVKTIGIVRVAFFAATVAGVALA